MFGYISVNKPELKFREFDVYRSYYCGLCRKLKEGYGVTGQLTLSYDMTFVILLLTGLYEPEEEKSACKCVAHPFEKHATRVNLFTEYIADMNLLLSYYKCKDDWEDERKVSRLLFSDAMKKKVKQIAVAFPKQAKMMAEKLKEISKMEQDYKENGASSHVEADMDRAAGYFGEIMGTIFVYREDTWKEELYQMGFFLGKFIYLMDAYEDMEKDQKSGNYNLFLQKYKEPDEKAAVEAKQIMTMMMAECCKAFEQLPIVEHVDILRNILYSGVWCRYEFVNQKRLKGQEHD